MVCKFNFGAHPAEPKFKLVSFPEKLIQLKIVVSG
jgi:hypothetical protein